MWTKDKVFYQIYPLGAFGCPFENDGKLVHRILDFENWMPHLKKLGIDVILWNPVFQSRTHGYDTTDFKQMDCRLGTNADFIRICKLLHENNMRVILDGVFNHVGRDFFAFQDVLKNRENSPYKDWFFIDFNGNNAYNDHLSYKNWQGNDILVILNLKNRELIDYLLGVVDFWMDTFDIDGLRLDVAHELDEDFMKILSHHCKQRDPEFFFVGEILFGDYNRLANPQMLDSVTNYECNKGLYSSFNSANLFEILHSLHRQFGKEPWCLYTGKQFLSFADNHDYDRIASRLHDQRHLPLLYTMVFTMPGIPCLYYGSEWGIKGKKNWNDTELRPHITHFEWNALTDHITKLIRIKHEHDALWACEYSQIFLTNKACIYQMESDSEKLWTVINMDEQTVTADVPALGQGIDLLSSEPVMVSGSLAMKPMASAVLCFKK